MALFPCPDCKKDVSDTAWACPQCGMPLRKARRAALVLGLAVSATVVLVVLALAVLAWLLFAGRRPD